MHNAWCVYMYMYLYVSMYFRFCNKIAIFLTENRKYFILWDIVNQQLSGLGLDLGSGLGLRLWLDSVGGPLYPIRWSTYPEN